MDSRTYLFLSLLSLIAFLGLMAFFFRSFTPQEDGMMKEKLVEQSRSAGIDKSGQLPPDMAIRREQVLPDHFLECHNSALSSTQRRALSLLALTILFTILAYLGYNLTFVQFQGRYLFPSLIPLGLFFTLGLSEALSRRWAWVLAGLLALALAWHLFTSVQAGQFDKWAILLLGTALILVAGRAWFSSPRWRLSPLWLMAACYAGLALLALAAPFWFILPNL
jgi:hypothetical protein